MKRILFLLASGAGLIKNLIDPRGISDITTVRKALYAKDSKGNHYLRVVRNFFHKGQDLSGAVTADELDRVERLERKSIVLASDGKPAVNLAVIINDANDIIKFKIGSISGTIDATAHTVSIELATGTVVTALMPEVLVSQGAQVSPRSGVETDFTNPVEYTVTAEDGTAQVWTVTVAA